MSPPTGCRVEFKDPNDIMNFTLYITPSDGMYIGATFTFSITIPHSYPYDPPKVHCDTLVYHPNIDLEGHVCLNILRQDWMPVLSLGSVIFGLMTLFLEPNPGMSFSIYSLSLRPMLFVPDIHSTNYHYPLPSKRSPSHPNEPLKLAVKHLPTQPSHLKPFTS